MELTKTYTKDHCYCQYDGQNQPQDAFLSLNLETGEVWADYNGEIGNAVPSRVWYGIVRRYSFKSTLRAETINNLIDEIAPLLQRVLDGSDVDWNGSNYAGTLNDDAESASEDAARLADEFGDWEDCLQIADPADWFDNVRENLVNRAIEVGVEKALEEAMAEETDVDIWDGDGIYWLTDLVENEIEKREEEAEAND